MSTTRDLGKMRKLSTADQDDVLFIRDINEAANQKEINTTETLYRYVVDNKIYKKSSILKVYDETAMSDHNEVPNPHWIEFQDPPKEEEEGEGPLFFRDPNEAKNQKLLKTDEKIYRYVKDDKLYKEGSILRAGHPKSAMCDKVAPQLPHWVEFRAPSKKEADEVEKLFFRDPNEAKNQKLIKTTENIYRYTVDDKLYKKSSILKVFNESVISDELAKPLPSWLEMRSTK